MNLRYPLAAVAAGMVIFATTGCTSASGMPALDRNPEPSDAWPGSSAPSEAVAAETSRHLATAGGHDYYVLTSTDRQLACLYRFDVPAGGEGSGGCSALGPADVIVQVTMNREQMALVRSDADTTELERAGWQRIHENILTYGS